MYANRRRARGVRGRRLLRGRGEKLERTFAHCYETGGLRRVHLRGCENIRKRLLIHTAGFNLSLLMRQLVGFGTPRGLAAGRQAVLATLSTCPERLRWLWAAWMAQLASAWVILGFGVSIGRRQRVGGGGFSVARFA